MNIIFYFFKANADLLGLLFFLGLLLIYNIIFPDSISVLRTILTYIGLLVLPGYLFLFVVLPRERSTISIVGLSLVFSMAISSLVATFLALALHINVSSILLSEIAISIILCAVALYQRRQHQLKTVSFKPLLYLVLISIIMGFYSMYWNSRLGSEKSQAFYILGERLDLSSLPERVSPNEKITIYLGIRGQGSFKIRSEILKSPLNIISSDMDDKNISVTFNADNRVGEQRIHFYLSGPSLDRDLKISLLLKIVDNVDK